MEVSGDNLDVRRQQMGKQIITTKVTKVHNVKALS